MSSTLKQACDSASLDKDTASDPPKQLKRELDFFGATVIGLASVIGVGIFVSLGLAAGKAGSAVIGALVVAGFLAACNSLNLAQLAANYPVSGGIYEYGYKYLTPWLGFTGGWIYLLGKTAVAATAALGFAGYLLKLGGLAERGFLVPALFKRVQEMGIEVWYSARGLALIQSSEQKITGIKVLRGETIAVEAKAVVLASGGFEADLQMRVRHLGSEWKTARVRGTPYNTGDGICMALAAGAQPYGDWAGCHAVATDLNAPAVGDFSQPGDIFKRHSYPLGLIVNKYGERFVDEGADFRNYTYAKYGQEILKQPGHLAYQIFDDKVAPLLREEYKRQEATRIEAPTLEALADQLDINKPRFLETVNSYNEAVQEGDYNPHSLDHKGTDDLQPPKSNWALRIDTPPFLAFPVTCGLTFTFGGLRVNPDGQVLDIGDRALSGLYAAGELVGGLFYHNYPGGAGLMAGATFGKIAGTSAAQYSLLTRT